MQVSIYSVVIMLILSFLCFCLSGRLLSKNYKNAFTKIIYTTFFSVILFFIVLYISISYGYLSNNDCENGMVAKILIWYITESMNIKTPAEIYIALVSMLLLPKILTFIFGGLSKTLPSKYQYSIDDDSSIFKMHFFQKNKSPNTSFIMNDIYSILSIIFMKFIIAYSASLISFGLIDSMLHLSKSNIGSTKEILISFYLIFASLSIMFIVFFGMSNIKKTNNHTFLSQDNFIYISDIIHFSKLNNSLDNISKSLSHGIDSILNNNKN